METEARQAQIDKSKAAIESVTKTDYTKLGRRAELAPNINFEDVVPDLQRMADVFVELGQRPIDILPTAELGKIEGAANQLLGLVTKVKEFSLDQDGNPKANCDGIKNTIRNSYDGVIAPLLIPLSFTATQATDYARREREAEGHNARLKRQHDEMLAFIGKAKEDAQRALEAVQEQAAQAGVSTNAQVFNKEAEDRAASSESWKKATMRLTWTTGIAALIGLAASTVWTPGTTPAAIHFVVSKLIVLSVLTFATVWCARNYRSQKHNETLSRHRAHALMTFKAFVEGTSDPHVKDAILVEAAEAAFSARPTGYESPHSPSTSNSNVADLIRSTMPRVTTTAATEST